MKVAIKSLDISPEQNKVIQFRLFGNQLVRDRARRRDIKAYVQEAINQRLERDSNRLAEVLENRTARQAERIGRR